MKVIVAVLIAIVILIIFIWLHLQTAFMPYTPYKKCKNYREWREINEHSKEGILIEYALTIILSFITAILTTLLFMG